MYKHCYLILLLSLCLSACQEEEFQPKNRAYFKFDLPKHNYQTFNDAGFPYRFSYPIYSKTVKDTLFFSKTPENPYWMNIDFPQWGGKIYLTYKPIASKNDFYTMINDAYKMTSAHEKRADYIKDPIINIPEKQIYGLFFDIGGNAASSTQFFITDSNKHFLRGALYFDVSPNTDSLKPINEFIRQDLTYLINSFEWTK